MLFASQLIPQQTQQPQRLVAPRSMPTRHTNVTVGGGPRSSFYTCLPVDDFGTNEGTNDVQQDALVRLSGASPFVSRGSNVRNSTPSLQALNEDYLANKRTFHNAS